MPLVERALGDGAWFLMVKGLANYRAGDFKTAIEFLSQARDNPSDSRSGTATIHLLLAMSHHRLGQGTEDVVGDVLVPQAEALGAVTGIHQR